MRTLAFLTLALVATVTSSMVTTTPPNAALVLLTFAGQVVGLVGAAYCTVRGLRSNRGWLPLR